MNLQHYFSTPDAAPGSPGSLIASFDNNAGARLMRGLPGCTANREQR
jgi:hypothetical protein